MMCVWKDTARMSVDVENMEKNIAGDGQDVLRAMWLLSEFKHQLVKNQ